MERSLHTGLEPPRELRNERSYRTEQLLRQIITGIVVRSDGLDVQGFLPLGTGSPPPAGRELTTAVADCARLRPVEGILREQHWLVRLLRVQWAAEGLAESGTSERKRNARQHSRWKLHAQRVRVRLRARREEEARQKRQAELEARTKRGTRLSDDV